VARVERPPELTWRLAVVGVLLETVLVWAYVGVLVYAGAGAPGVWRVIGFFGLWALAFAGLAVALVRRRPWVRAPLIVLQFLLIASGLTMRSGGEATFGVILIMLAVLVTGLLLAPGTRATLGAR